MLGLFLTVKPQINAGNILTGIQPVRGVSFRDTEQASSGNPSVYGPGEPVRKQLFFLEPQHSEATWPWNLHSLSYELGKKEYPKSPGNPHRT